MGLERLRIRVLVRGIQIIRIGKYRIGIQTEHLCRISIEERTVGLEMNKSGRLDNLLIASHEIGGSKTLGSFLHLRVAERDPDLIHLVFGKE